MNRLRHWLDEGAGQSVFPVAAVVLLVGVCLLVVRAWGLPAALVVVFAFALAALRVAVEAYEVAQDALAEARVARSKVDAVEAYLTGLEPAGSGRHSSEPSR